MSAAQCRLCGAPLGTPFIDLGSSPLSNALVAQADLGSRDAMYPLRAYACERCWLVQVPEHASPERIFRDYPYFSSYSTTWLEHVRRYARDVRERLRLDARSLVVEIASNDGHLLSEFQHEGIGVLGVEPAANVAQVAVERGVPTVVEFLNAASGQRLRERGTAADLLVANNVLAHVPDLDGFVAGLAALLKPQGLLTLEFPHVARMLERVEFDTIYHEHFSYFSLATARRALARHGLAVFDVEELPTHGGSLRVYAALGSPRPTSAVDALLRREIEAGLNRLETYETFARRSAQAKELLRAFVRGAREEGANVAGYGAPAKATTLLNYCGIGTDLLAYTVDRSPHKQGRFIPGVRTPIFAPERIFATKPEFVLILPWNIADEVREQMSGINRWGGRFAVPVPALEVLA
ncbi:MAG: class I SAM-dependent methyltransferase [Candidatus Eremiobacteraeota bacterium]|nr:class I SAM-dependent methyltransferase [Candidatus Eremiobacteraeota bacterium]MBV8365834.1 class I SAM-dependent methyltransferase [Candidatus Eremiobacteraeota bacterium]